MRAAAAPCTPSIRMLQALQASWWTTRTYFSGHLAEAEATVAQIKKSIHIYGGTVQHEAFLGSIAAQENREVARLTEAAKEQPLRPRDATMILVAYRHGFRVSELVDLRWDQINFDAANLAVRRAKKGSPSTHPILGDELRALRKLQREQEPQVRIRLYVGARFALRHGGLCSACRARGCDR